MRLQPKKCSVLLETFFRHFLLNKSIFIIFCRCKRPPCNTWSLGDAQCFICDQSCASLHSVDNPRSDALLSSLKCVGSCDKIVVNSNGPAAVWQNKRTGLFKFIGEHNGRPVYQNNATKEFLFYTTVGSEWLVGPDFRKPHAGIQVCTAIETLMERLDTFLRLRPIHDGSANPKKFKNVKN